MKKHGGYFGLDKKNVIDFSVNINPLGVPKSLKEKLRSSIDTLEGYPEIDGYGGKCALSKKLNINVDNVILGSGATELIYLFSKTFKLKTILIVEPTFTEYERAFVLNESQVHHFLTKEIDDFKIDIGNLLSEIESLRPDLLVICNPNNPTGVFTEKEILKPVLDKMKDINSMIFIDESFIDFTEKKSYISLIEDYPLFLLRSMTKIYAVPGLRIGYGLGNIDMIKNLNKYKEPWTINSLALDSVEILLDDDEYLEKTSNWYTREKEYLRSGLNSIENLKVYESDGNFFLCKLKTSNSKTLRDYLIDKGIYIRTCEDFYGLSEYFIRLAIRTKEENMVLLEGLSEYFTI